jgi:hypothetical protein
VSLTAEPRPRRSRRRRSSIAGAVTVVLAILIGLLAERWHDAQPYSGDEPHYLLITNSLILDGDVDLKNDYLNGRYFKYTHSWIDPHVNTNVFTPESRHWYSQHGVGLPAVLVPAVVADDAKGATAEMVLIATLVLLLAFLWVRRFTAKLLLAGVATATLGASPFFLGLEGRIFPDLPTAALLLGCLLILELRARRGWHLLLLGMLVAMSPWFHFKNALAFGAVVAIAAVQVARNSFGGERARRLVLLTAPVFVSVAGYELAVHSWYGSWLPTAMFPPGNEAFALDPATGAASASFDSARGLLANDPALMLILAGLPLWMRRWPGPFLRLALVLGPTILVQATFNDWSGGYAPGARYALQFTPALLPAVALLLQEASRAFRSLAAVLLALQGALAAAFVWLHPPWGFTGSRSPFLSAIDEKLGIALDRAMPTFDSRGALVRGEWRLAAWLLAAGVLLAYGAQLAHRRISGPALVELKPSPTSGRS